MDPEIGGHLLDRHTRTAVPRDPHNVLAELFRIRLGPSDILPTCPTEQASSDVTRSCGRPSTRTRLSNPEADTYVQEVTRQHLADWLDHNPNQAAAIIRHIVNASTGRGKG
ncbi:hypothetical protein [Streptomyces sp. NPDC085665]|uniref:hypothetical protein n=1 Tax=Streptomyces sp. NPDC085665 TaxID=3365735 RepID=UPI0037D78B0A